MSTLGMVGEPELSLGSLKKLREFRIACDAAYYDGYITDAEREAGLRKYAKELAILESRHGKRELRKQSEGKGKDGGKS